MRIVRFYYTVNGLQKIIDLLVTGPLTGFEVWPTPGHTFSWTVDDSLTTIVHPIHREEQIASVQFVSEVLT